MTNIAANLMSKVPLRSFLVLICLSLLTFESETSEMKCRIHWELGKIRTPDEIRTHDLP